MLPTNLDLYKQKSRKSTKIYLLLVILLSLTFAGFYYVYSKQYFQVLDETTAAFEDFQQKYERGYGIQEREMRFKIFRENYNFIKDHNADKDKTFTLEINNFADMTKEEIRKYMGLKPKRFDREILDQKYKKKNDLKQERKLSQVPGEIDWVEKGAVAAIRNQQSCGSCWSFAGTSTIESAYYLKHSKMLDLSEQQAVDCSFKYGKEGDKNSGCDGGETSSLYDYYTDYNIQLENDYPYTSGITGKPEKYEEAQCKYQKGNGVTKVSQYYSIYYDQELEDQNANEEQLKIWVAQQPVAHSVYASCQYFYFYSRGVVNKDCEEIDLDHAVVAVGYGYRDGLKYWRVRNSWGQKWGENGYIFIARKDDSNSYGLFGMALDFTYPNLV